jgi:hypothetical protein
MKGALPSLVRLAHRGGTSDFCPALAVLVWSVKNTFFLNGHHISSFASRPHCKKG